MDKVFKKSFRFEVDGFEQWENRECVKEGEIDNGTIIAYLDGDALRFELFGLESLHLPSSFCMNAVHHFSRILDVPDNGLVTKGRIQYFNDSFLKTPDQPHICQLFCQDSRISIIRFAFPIENPYPLFPLTKFVYELYGDMSELGKLSKDSYEMLKSVGIDADEFLPYFEDEFSIRVMDAYYNPYKITSLPKFNKRIKWNDLTHLFKEDFSVYYMEGESKDLLHQMCGFTENMIGEYFRTCGYVPKAVVDEVIKEVYDAVKALFQPIECLPEYSLFKLKMYNILIR